MINPPFPFRSAPKYLHPYPGGDTLGKVPGLNPFPFLQGFTYIFTRNTYLPTCTFLTSCAKYPSSYGIFGTLLRKISIFLRVFYNVPTQYFYLPTGFGELSYAKCSSSYGIFIMFLRNIFIFLRGLGNSPTQNIHLPTGFL